jgi:replication initiation and membrane attachment protein DnaB
MVHYEAMTDLRALELLESLTSKEYVMELIEGDLDEPMTFKKYPKSDMYLITLRNRVNKEIAKYSAK